VHQLLLIRTHNLSVQRLMKLANIVWV